MIIMQVVRLWVHECERVFSDRLINNFDMNKFNEYRINITKKFFDNIPQVLNPLDAFLGQVNVLCKSDMILKCS